MTRKPMTLAELRAYCAEHAERIYVRVRDELGRLRQCSLAELEPAAQDAQIVLWHERAHVPVRLLTEDEMRARMSSKRN